MRVPAARVRLAARAYDSVCARVAQLALTCKFDNSRGQLNGTRELLAGISRERMTLLVNGTVFVFNKAVNKAHKVNR